MRLTLCLVGTLVALSGLVSPASAQVQTGSIFIKVIDESGAGVPGATLTLISPVLPRPLTGVTDEGGAQRFPSLAIGTYKITAMLDGFQTTTREGLLVVQNQTVTIDVTLKVGALTDLVTVQAESPIVDSKSATIATNLDVKVLDTTPGGKDIWSILEYKIPGLVFDTPDVGGNQAGLQRGFTSRGTPNNQNVQLVNGVNVGDPAAIGFSMNYYEPATFENVQVTTGAQDISMGTSGTLINMVTRSGTNQFGGRASATYQGKGTQWDNVDDPLLRVGFRPEAQAVGYISNANYQNGGPVITNKLFFFANINNQQTHVNVPGYPAIPPPQVPQRLSGNVRDSTGITSTSGKMNYSLGANRLEGYGNYQWYDKPNRGAAATVTLDSNTKEYDTFLISQLSWNSVLSTKLVADTKIAYSNTHFPLTQKTDMQTLLDNTTGVRHRNSAASNFMFRRRLQFTSNWSLYLAEVWGVRHELKFGLDHGYTPEDVQTTRVDDVNLTFRSLAGTAAQPAGAGTVQIFNSPLDVKRAVQNTALYAQDLFTVGRLTLVAGLRWERLEAYLPEQSHPASHYFPAGTTIGGLNVTLNTGGVLTDYVVRDSFAAVRNAPLWTNWAPRVSGTYDVFGSGKTVLKIAAGKYYDQVGTGTPGPNHNGAISQTYTWNDINNDLVFQSGNATWNGRRYVGGEFGTADPTTAIPNPNPFDGNRRRTYRNEVTIGLDHELFPSFRLSGSYIRRIEKDTYGDVDGDITQWDRMFSPIQVTDPGRDGLAGTADDQPLTVYNLNPGITLVTDTPINDDRLGAHYNGVEIVATKRYSRGTTLLGGYTYSNEHVELTSLANPNEAYVNADGVSGGRRHNLKVSGSAMLPYGMLFGGNLILSSGRPITRRFAVPACTAGVTTGCLTQGATTVNAEPRGSVELPGRFQIDVRMARMFRLAGRRLELGLDAYNLTNENTVFDVRNTTGLTNIRYANDPSQPITQIATFLSPTGVLGPRILRVNFTLYFGGDRPDD